MVPDWLGVEEITSSSGYVENLNIVCTKKGLANLIDSSNERFRLFQLRMFEDARNDSGKSQQEDEGFVNGHDGIHYEVLVSKLLCAFEEVGGPA